MHGIGVSLKPYIMHEHMTKVTCILTV